MPSLCSFVGFVFISYVGTYENIALRKPAYQQNRYTGLPSVYSQASNAVDGQKSNLSWQGGQCTISDNDQRTATWWVNLTQILSIHHITIYYRTGNVEWGPTNGFTPRFLGFSVYVSNTPNRLEGTLCFKDTDFNINTIPAVFNIRCPVHGQYVIYYNERLPEVKYLDDYSKYAYNELCEVEVYGCLDPRLYGINCSSSCPDANCLHCHIETGTCKRCKSGYRGHRCELECEDNYFGPDCKEKCYTTCKDCNKVTGVCENQCHAGWEGEYCHKKCDVGYFGENCGSQCGHCYQNETCHHISGNCSRGCGPGYQGPSCNDECIVGKYGLNCTEECGFCLDLFHCFHENGSCLKGCRSGFKGTLCKEVAVPLTTTIGWMAGFFGLLVVFCSLLIGIVIALVRKSKKRLPEMDRLHKSTNQTKHNEMDDMEPSVSLQLADMSELLTDETELKKLIDDEE